ncbi:MAG: 3-phosphoshikimate 1-carboxyvinyltransferase [Rickettsiales bacterium]|nr:3-phosphoshikimate 1-carboxyvinyltransferase [Rickettsiales bacterium]
MKIFPKKNSIKGSISVSGDKSCSHRALIFASLMQGVSKIYGLLESEDVLATLNALQKMGVPINKKEDNYEIFGSGFHSLISPKQELNLQNSGTGVRLLMGLVSTQDLQVTFTGDNSLSSRPMARVTDPLSKFLVKFNLRDGNFLPAHINGNADAIAINYKINIPSAQIKTALILAALHANGTSEIIETKLTRDHTELMMQYLGFPIDCKIVEKQKIIKIKGNQDNIKARNIKVSSDPSSAAFLIAAALLAPESDITINNVIINPHRIGFFETLKEMGAKIQYLNIRNESGEEIADIRAKYSKLNGIEIAAEKAASMIDEYPILSVIATQAEGKTTMYGLKELRVKESDRLAAIIKNLEICGVKTKSGEDWLTVEYTKKIKAKNIIKTYDDHRIAMSFLILGLVSEEGLAIDDASMINTSFPEFFDKLNQLGINFAR